MRCSTSRGATRPQCVVHARGRTLVVAARASRSASTSTAAPATAHQQLPAEGGDGRGVSLGPVTAEQLAAHNTLFTSLLKEYAYDVKDEWVTGTIPPELCGTYFRNGPGLQDDDLGSEAMDADPSSVPSLGVTSLEEPVPDSYCAVGARSLHSRQENTSASPANLPDSLLPRDGDDGLYPSVRTLTRSNTSYRLRPRPPAESNNAALRSTPRDYRELGPRADGPSSANASPSHMRPSRISSTGQHRPLDELLSQAKSLSRLCYQFGGVGGIAASQSGSQSRTFADAPSLHGSPGASSRTFSRASSSKFGGPLAAGPSSLGGGASSAALVDPAPAPLAGPADGTNASGYAAAASPIRSTQSRDVSPGTPRYLGSPGGGGQAPPGPGRRISHLGDSGVRSAEIPVFRRASNGGMKLAVAVAAAAAAGDAAAAAALSPTAQGGAAAPFASRSRHALLQGISLGSPSPGGSSGGGSPAAGQGLGGGGGSNKKSNVIQWNEPKSKSIQWSSELRGTVNQWNEQSGSGGSPLRGTVPLPPPPPLPQQLSPAAGRPTQSFPHVPHWQQPSPALSEPHHLQSPVSLPSPPPPHPPPPRAPAMQQQQQPVHRRASSLYHSMPIAPLSLGATPSGHRFRDTSSFHNHEVQLAAVNYDFDSDEDGAGGGANGTTLLGGAGRERNSAGAELCMTRIIDNAVSSAGDDSGNSSSGGAAGRHRRHTLTTMTSGKNVRSMKHSSSNQQLQLQLQQLQQQQQQQGSSLSTSPHHSGVYAHPSSTRSRKRFTMSDDGRSFSGTPPRPAAGAAGAAATAALAAMASGLAGMGIDRSTSRRISGPGTGSMRTRLPRQLHGAAQQQQQQQGGGAGAGSGGVSPRGGAMESLSLFADPHGLLPTVFSESLGAEAAAAAAAGVAAGPPHPHPQPSYSPDQERRTPQPSRAPQQPSIVVRDLQTMSLPQPGIDRSSDARSLTGGEGGGGDDSACGGLSRAGSRSRLRALVPSLVRSLVRGAAALVSRKDRSVGQAASAAGGGGGGGDLATMSAGSDRVVPL
ncbi:hypothetical protein HYH02_003564 [Chlamydomonas schloesseri]|uniref:Uncharacterized protein n=1 Tax=Chlamydomonas schloesseri TaxID=2026947 RepID=A0A835WS02_9CHLO|nr:hypothetical protein HYH02_003564 [Chlamydomonas schloesseri]|eukprot:KAG2451786.1 hypothetical protein HYH02_003564 [Chlamydomonas schloesseri]